MSFNDLADSFSKFPENKNKNCKHLRELFNQAAIMIEEEEKDLEIQIPIKKPKLKSKNSKSV